VTLSSLTSAILTLSRRLWTIRDSTICPVHHEQALATGHVRDDRTQWEYEHCAADTGKQHYFWVSSGLLKNRISR
jgi:hypothetical protein